jgi:HEAT repeat protein
MMPRCSDDFPGETPKKISGEEMAISSGLGSRRFLLPFLLVLLHFSHALAKDPQTAAEWIQRLKNDAEPFHRADAAAHLSLSENASEEAIIALIDSLHDDEIADPNRLFYPGPLRTVASEALSSLQKIGKPAVPFLIKRYAGQPETHRSSFLTLFGRIGRDAQSAVPLVINATSDDSEWVRQTALVTLGEMTSKNETALPHFIAALKDSSPEVRSVALLELRTWQPPPRQALEDIRKLLHDPSERAEALAPDFIGSCPLRGDAVKALAAIAEPGDECVPVLRDLMKNDPRLRVQAFAAEAVVRLDPVHDDAIDHLIQLLDTREGEFSEGRLAALESLGELGPAAKKAFPKLIDMIKHSDPAFLGPAGLAAARIDPSRAEPDLLSLLENEESVSEGIEALALVPHLSTASIHGLMELLRPKGDLLLMYWDEHKIFELLAKCGKRAAEAIPVLKQVAGNEDEWAPTREAAQKAIKSIQDAPIVTE